MRKGRISTTKWNLFFQYTAFALIVVQGVVLVPLYLKSIPLGLYGAWLASGNILAWITIADPGMGNIIMQRVATAFGAREYDSVGESAAVGAVLSALIAALIFGAGWWVAPHVALWANVSDAAEADGLRRAFLWALSGTALMVLAYAFAAVNQGLQSSIGIGLLQVSGGAMAIVITVWLLLAGWRLEALGLATFWRGAFALVGNALFSAHLLRRFDVRYEFRTARVIEIARVVTWTARSRIFLVVAMNCESFVIARVLGGEAAAILSLTRRAPDAARMLVERPSLAIAPALAHLAGESGHARTGAIALRLLRFQIWAVGLFAAGFLALNEDFVRLWVGPQAFAGDTVNLLVVAVLAVSAMSTAFFHLLEALGNFRGNSRVIMLESVFLLTLLVPGVYVLGIAGAVIAPLVAISSASLWYGPLRLARLTGLPKPESLGFAWEIAKTGAAAAVAWVVGARLSINGWLGFILAAVAISACYGFMLYALSARFRSELRSIAPMIFRKR